MEKKLESHYIGLTASELYDITSDETCISKQQKSQNAKKQIKEMYEFYYDCKKNPKHEQYSEFIVLNKQIILYEHIMSEIIKNNYCELIGSTSNIYIYGEKIHNIDIHILNETLQLFVDLGFYFSKFEKKRTFVKYTIRK